MDNNEQEKRLSCSGSVKDGITNYEDLHDESQTDTSARNSNYKALVNAYYDLATVFYEWGWGPCFHFSSRFNKFESFWEATRRHEYQLASKLNIVSKGARSQGHILDVGCGIGGPMRNIARFLNCKVTGITLNPYQVDRGNEENQKDPTVADKCTSVQGDFMNLPFEKETFDGAYAIEATCHAPDRVACYKQVYDVLKPGAHFALYEWCLTDKYDPNNPKHVQMKKDIEIGNGLPDIATTKDCCKALQDAGFELLDEYDVCTDPTMYEARGLALPWMTPLLPSWNPLSQRFQFNKLGGPITNFCIYMLECLYIAPKGTINTQQVLQTGAFALRDAGMEQIFTTAYLMVGRKPTK